jgi:hypothetical protein
MVAGDFSASPERLRVASHEAMRRKRGETVTKAGDGRRRGEINLRVAPRAVRIASFQDSVSVEPLQTKPGWPVDLTNSEWMLRINVSESACGKQFEADCFGYRPFHSFRSEISEPVFCPYYSRIIFGLIRSKAESNCRSTSVSSRASSSDRMPACSLDTSGSAIRDSPKNSVLIPAA